MKAKFFTTAGAVLSELRNTHTSGARRRELITCAELLRFGEDQRSELLSLLWEFIIAYRDSNELDDLIAVGSAIRKYVANVETAQLDSLATLLEPGHAGAPSLHVKLETVKMIYRSFEADPPPSRDPHPQLAQRVYEIAKAYLDPNVLLDGQNAAVAMLAVQALIAMLSGRASDALAMVRRLPEADYWFREQLRRRLVELRDRWGGHAAASRDLSEAIEGLK